MNNQIKILIFVAIIILLFILYWVFVNYHVIRNCSHEYDKTLLIDFVNGGEMYDVPGIGVKTIYTEKILLHDPKTNKKYSLGVYDDKLCLSDCTKIIDSIKKQK